mgnify:CR=1 FL=1
MSDQFYSSRIDNSSGQLTGKNLEQLICEINTLPPLNNRQQENVTRLMVLSKKFHDRTGIPSPQPEQVTASTIILESGHQPNFLPHSGIFKKAFLLSCVQQRVKKSGRPCIAFFSFADQNLSTAKLLYRTHIQAVNKEGTETFGFPIAENDRFKKFCSLPKPPIDAWLNGLEKIKKHYLADFSKLKNQPEKNPLQLGKILDILQKSYESAENFAELNATIFARICHEVFGIELRFVLHSELQNELLFVEESRRLLQHYRNYNQIYNQIINEKNLKIPTVHLNHLPFWYHCTCGVKIDLYADESNIARGECPHCYRKYALAFGQDFIRLPEYYARMDFNAVSRNIVWAEGLGDALFIPGAGGSLQYGMISDQITKKIGFREPLILFWRSKDYYLGLTHILILEDISKTLSSDIYDLSRITIPEKITELMKNQTDRISAAKSTADNDAKNLKTLKNDLNRLSNLLSTAENNFTITPSTIDLLVNHDSQIPALWDEILNKSLIFPNGQINKIEADVVYPSLILPGFVPEDLLRLYTSFKKSEMSI